MNNGRASSTAQRTLAVLFAPHNQLHAQQIRQLLVDDGFKVTAEDKLPGEELEEAGLDLGLGVGGEDGAQDEYKEDGVLHVVLVLEREDAVSRLKESRSSSIATDFPELRIFAAPSASAASMAIDVLFPSLPPSPAPQSPSTLSFPSTSPTTSKPKPFALSNLAFQEAQAASTPSPAERRLSPSIERALEEQAEREERRRTGSGSTRSSVSTPRIASRASGFASTQAEDGFTQDEGEMRERRVFTAHSRESSADFDAVADEEDEAAADEAAEGEAAVGTENVQDEAVEPAVTSDLVLELQQDDDVVSLDLDASTSPSLLSAPTLSRTTSNLSAASSSSNPSSSSFRARPAPSSKPSIQPRLSKTAALRLGISLPPTAPRRQSSETSTSDAARPPSVARVVPTPKSLAAPSIAPRMTKTASLRSGQDASAPTPKPVKRHSMGTAERAAMDRLARRHSVAAGVTPAPEPAVAVRMSRAAMLRQSKDVPPPAPRLSRQSSATSADELVKPASSTATKRLSLSANLKSLREPLVAPRSTRSSTLRNGSDALQSPPMSRGRSLGTVDELLAAQQKDREREPVDFSNTPGHKRRESVSVRATAPPKMEVRMSKAARLRAGMPAFEEPKSEEMKRAKTEPTANAYEGVPGHRRPSSFTVASTKAPSITPRLNRAVLLRQSSDDASSAARRPSSAMASLAAPSPAKPLRAPSRSGGAATSSSASSTAAPAPAIAPRLNRAAELRAAKKAGETTPKKPVAGAKPAGRPSTSLGLALRELTNSPVRK
ncbi:hypothetical protein JCM8097_005970 [Rhodosporidiobolus ruineniae]